MTVSPIYQVNALWDDEASVWVATSDDVLGLATEAESLEALRQKLRQMLPELLMLNHVLAENLTGTISLRLVTQQQELIEVAA
jgi:predicted RNase H-like HicB family nuclease